MNYEYLVYDADYWMGGVIFAFTGFLFWLFMWLGLWSFGVILKLIKDSLK